MDIICKQMILVPQDVINIIIKIPGIIVVMLVMRIVEIVQVLIHHPALIVETEHFIYLIRQEGIV